MRRGVTPTAALPTPAFHPLSTSHLAVLSLTALLALFMVWMRRRDMSSIVWLERMLLGALLLQWPAAVYAHQVLGDFSKQNALPIHLCDVAAFAGITALVTRSRLAAEICYFFGLTGTLQGLFTPALREDFPHARFVAFFLGHSAVVITAVYVVAGLRLTPGRHAPLRMLGWLLLYAGVVGGINALIGTNYGFLCQKAPSPSLMDLLGPWPLYIGSLVGVAAVVFTLLDLPFIRRRSMDLSLPRQSD